MDRRRVIESYYRAFRERDRATLETIVVPRFRHLSSYGSWDDRDAMLDAIWPAVGPSWATDLRVYGDGPEYMVRYELESSPETARPRVAMAERVLFDGERIAEIEVFTGRELGGG